MDIKSFLMVYPLFFAFLAVFTLAVNRPQYAVPIYYAGVFLRRILLPAARVRQEVIVDLAIMGILLLASVFGGRKREEKLEAPAMRGGKAMLAILLAVVPLESIIGRINGYEFFQILVDVYKSMEILLFFFAVQLTWKTVKQAEDALFVLSVEMCVLGVYEMFITERGGVGLHIVMSVFPILFSLGFEKRVRYYWPVTIISLVIIFMCKTRTYMLGMLSGTFVILCFGRGRRKKSILQKGLLLAMGSAVAVGIAGNFVELRSINTVLARISDLLEGGLANAGGYRVYEIQTAVSKFRESPFFGKGFGYMEYVYIQLMGYFEWGDFMHNAFVEILCKTGIYGSLIYGAGLTGFIGVQIRKIRQAQAMGWSKAASILIGGLGGTVSWLVVYMAAPLSSYGVVFLPGIVSMSYFALFARENKQRPALPPRSSRSILRTMEKPA